MKGECRRRDMKPPFSSSFQRVSCSLWDGLGKKKVKAGRKGAQGKNEGEGGQEKTCCWGGTGFDDWGRACGKVVGLTSESPEDGTGRVWGRGGDREKRRIKGADLTQVAPKG